MNWLRRIIVRWLLPEIEAQQPRPQGISPEELRAAINRPQGISPEQLHAAINQSQHEYQRRFG